MKPFTIFAISLILFNSVSARDYEAVPSISDIGTQINKESEAIFNDISKDIRGGNLNLKTEEYNYGKNLPECKFEDGRKVCKCPPGFAIGRDNICVNICNESRTCANGGSCLQHVCVCLPGTSGPFCEVVDDCQNNKLCVLNEHTRCAYHTEKQKAECECGVHEYRFDAATKTCRDCLCTDVWSQKLYAFNNCEYQQGNKICTCTKGFAYNPRWKYCDACTCGKHTKWCKFDQDGNKVCTCEDGYYSRYEDCLECKCGPHGKCQYVSTWTSPKATYCKCDVGYDEFNETCVECKCGKYGSCIFDENGTQIGCKCEPGYEEKLGKCEMCYCGDNIACSFRGEEKVCNCTEGYHNINGFCEDINECESHSPCESSAKCFNIPGSYKCICAEGYQKYNRLLPNSSIIEACEDINECKNPNSCLSSDFECVNTPGSFACVCNPGLLFRGGVGAETFCEKTADESIYTVVVVIIFTTLLLLLGFYMFTKRK